MNKREENIALKVGDFLYYAPHNALGVLINKYTDDHGQNWWEYALRSTRSKNASDIIVSTQSTEERKCLTVILAGDLEHYPI